MAGACGTRQAPRGPTSGHRIHLQTPHGQEPHQSHWSASHSGCGNLNLCAGLPSGIEGAVHAVRATPNPEQTEGEAPLPPEPPTQEAEAPVGADPFGNMHIPTGTLLVDARNGFNELSRKAMLWTVKGRWTNGAKFAFNCYRHAGQLILRRQGQELRDTAIPRGGHPRRPSLHDPVWNRPPAPH